MASPPIRLGYCDGGCFGKAAGRELELEVTVVDGAPRLAGEGGG